METVVFLHGWGVRPENFQVLINLLRKKYYVVAPNLCQLTDKKSFSWKKFSDNLDKFIDEKKVYLIGTSLGGGLALAYAAYYPEKTKVVIACEPAGGKIKINKIVGALLLIKMTARALFYPNGLKIVSKVRFSFLRESVLHFKEIRTQIKLVLEKDLEKTFKNIKAPVYLLWSKNSSILPLWMGERIHQKIATSKFEPSFSNKNHLWCLFEQEKIAEKAFKKFCHPSTRGEGRGLRYGYRK